MILEELCFIDFEASGLYDSFPIQVGLATDEKYVNELIKPDNLWLSDYTWDHNAEKIHHLKLSHIKENGVDVKIVAEKLLDAIAARSVISDNAHFDQRWFNILMDAAQIKKTMFIFDVSQIFRPRDLVFYMRGIFFYLEKNTDGIQNDKDFIEAISKEIKIVYPNSLDVMPYPKGLSSHDALSDAISLKAAFKAIYLISERYEITLGDIYNIGEKLMNQQWKPRIWGFLIDKKSSIC